MVITVVTVARNNAATIAATMRSVAEQSFRGIEHVVVDGASTDGTLDIVRRHGAARLLSEPDAGIYDAMNKGLRMATGDVVGFLNADDMFANGEAVARIARAFQEPAVGAAFGDLVYVAARDPARVVRHWRAGAFSPSRLAFGWMAPHPTLYVRRELATALGGFDARFRIAADYDFMLRLFRHPRANPVYVPSVLVRMRTGGASNGSAKGLVRKSMEDLAALRAHGVGGVPSVCCKILRKAPQLTPLLLGQHEPAPALPPVHDPAALA